jgi:hypothetical protein
MAFKVQNRQVKDCEKERFVTREWGHTMDITAIEPPPVFIILSPGPQIRHVSMAALVL